MELNDVLPGIGYITDMTFGESSVVGEKVCRSVLCPLYPVLRQRQPWLTPCVRLVQDSNPELTLLAGGGGPSVVNVMKSSIRARRRATIDDLNTKDSAWFMSIRPRREDGGERMVVTEDEDASNVSHGKQKKSGYRTVSREY